jgi:hypothetical protein
VQTTGEIVQKGNKLTVGAPVVARVGNKEILEECVRQNRIADTTGWRIMCYYDARMEGTYVYGAPTLVLRNVDGRSAEIYPVLQLEVVNSVASGSATIGSGGKISGTVNRRALVRLRFQYQGETGVCTGLVPFAMKVSGTTSEYIGAAGAINKAALYGQIGEPYGDPDLLVSVQLSTGAFKRMP